MSSDSPVWAWMILLTEWLGEVLSWVLFFGGILFVAMTCDGCSDKDPPPGMSLIRVHGPASDETSKERLGTAAREWDSQAWPAQRADVEVREADPFSKPPYCYGCDPYTVINGQAGIGFTFPQQSIVVVRGEEWVLVHEFLHVQQQMEGLPPDVQHKDVRWEQVQKVANALRERMR